MATTSQGDTPKAAPRKLVYLPTIEAYDRWASVYDSDGNILQALDSYALTRTMFERLLRNIPSKDKKSQPSPSADGDALHLTDFGCGTGRATLLLLSTLRSNDSAIAKSVSANGFRKLNLTAVDASAGMLAVANGKIPASSSIGDDLVVKTLLCQWDMFQPDSRFKPLSDNAHGNGQPFTPQLAHAVVSTLVLEHIPADVYFERAKTLLRPRGVFLMTNMHDEMGNKSFSAKTDSAGDDNNNSGVDGGSVGNPPIATAAGFIDKQTNTKIRGDSYAHSVDDVLQAAKGAGFELVDNVEELKVEPWMFEEGSSWETGGEQPPGPLLGSRGTKWLGTKCWFGMVFRLAG